VEKISSANGGTIWSREIGSEYTFRSVDALLDDRGRLRVTGSFSKNLSAGMLFTFVYDDGGEVVDSSMIFPGRAPYIITTSVDPTGALSMVSASDLNFISLWRTRSLQDSGWAVVSSGLPFGSSYVGLRTDAIGNVTVLTSEPVNPVAPVRVSLRRFDTAGRELWHRNRVGDPDDPGPIRAVQGVSAMETGDQGEIFLAGPGVAGLVVERYESKGALAWRYIDSTLAPRDSIVPRPIAIVRPEQLRLYVIAGDTASRSDRTVLTILLLRENFSTGGIDHQLAIAETAGTITDCSAHPNPISDAAVIRYTTTRDAEVTIELYDVMGEKLGRLLRERQSAGDHEVVFSASDHGVPSGSYVVRLAAGARVRTLPLRVAR
jgi:hypothetical protein